MPVRSRGLVEVLLALSLVTAGACSSDRAPDGASGSGEGGAGPTPGAVPEDVGVEEVSLKLPARLYLVAGTRRLASELYEFTPAAGGLDRLTAGGRLDVVTGCPGSVLVAASQAEVGFDSHLQEFRNGALRPVPALGRPPGYVPVASPGCQLAYLWYASQDSAETEAVFTWSPGEREPALVTSGPTGEISAGDWGPDGTLVLIRGPREGPQTVVFRSPDGAERPVDVGVADVGSVQWSGRGVLAVNEVIGDGRRGVVFVDSERGGIGRLDGWGGLDVSPDGSQLLVVDAATERQLGLVAFERPDVVQPLARLSAPIWDGAWLAGDGPSPIKGPSPLAVK